MKKMHTHENCVYHMIKVTRPDFNQNFQKFIFLRKQFINSLIKFIFEQPYLVNCLLFFVNF